MSVGPLGEPGGLFFYDEGDGEPAAGGMPFGIALPWTRGRELPCGIL